MALACQVGRSWVSPSQRTTPAFTGFFFLQPLDYPLGKWAELTVWPLSLGELAAKRVETTQLPKKCVRSSPFESGKIESGWGSPRPALSTCLAIPTPMIRCVAYGGLSRKTLDRVCPLLEIEVPQKVVI